MLKLQKIGLKLSAQLNETERFVSAERKQFQDCYEAVLLQSHFVVRAV